MKLEDLLRTFIVGLGKDEKDFEFDSEFGSVLSLDDGRFQIKIEPNEQEVWLHCEIIAIPKFKRVKFYEKLLTGQLFGKFTKGAHFSLNIENQQVLLCKSFSIENISQDEFDIQLNEFFEMCLAWRKILKEMK